MADWNPEEPLPGQIADAFAALYDWFEDRHMDDVRKSQWMERIERDFDRTALRRAVEATNWETPRFLQDQLDQAREHGETQTALAVYACLIAIDDGLADVHPRKALAGPLWNHYETCGRYNDAYHGYVLPAWAAHPYRGAMLASYLKWLTRARVDRDHVRLIRLHSLAPEVRGEDNPTVVIAPFLYELERPAGSSEKDTRFRGRQVAGRHYFEVRHLDGEPVDLKQRVSRVVAEVRKARATVAIFPELTLSDGLLEVLKDALFATVEDEPALKWVIAGHYEPKVDGPGEVSSTFRFFNAAAVLDQFGNVVGERAEIGEPGWVQRKRHPYKLTAQEQKETYGMGNVFTSRHNREEAISLGNQVFVFEGRSGRTAITICEDFGQEDRTCAELRRMGCSDVVVILMDGPMVKSRWAPSKARPFVEQTGARVIVANSLVLPNLPKCVRVEPNRDEKGRPTRPVGYLVEPPIDDDQPASDPRFVEAVIAPDETDDSLISPPVLIRPAFD